MQLCGKYSFVWKHSQSNIESPMNIQHPTDSLKAGSLGENCQIYYREVFKMVLKQSKLLYWFDWGPLQTACFQVHSWRVGAGFYFLELMLPFWLSHFAVIDIADMQMLTSWALHVFVWVWARKSHYFWQLVSIEEQTSFVQHGIIFFRVAVSIFSNHLIFGQL